MKFEIVRHYDHGYGILESQVHAHAKEFKDFPEALDAVYGAFPFCEVTFDNLDMARSHAWFKVEGRSQYEDLSFELRKI